MPTDYGPRRAVQVTVRISPSVACELSFIWFVVRAHGSWHRPDPPWIAPFIAEWPGLYDRIRGFWGDERAADCSDILVLAERTGEFFADDGEALLERLGEAAASNEPLPALRSEGPEGRRLIQGRLERLATSPKTREAYLSLMRDTWAAVAPEWRERGLPAVTVRCAAWQEQVDRGANPLQVLPATSMARQQRLGSVDVASLVAEAMGRGTLALVPVYFAGEGHGLVELRDWLVVSEGVAAGQEMERRRERAAEAARRFKVLSDPTRLAILTYLVRNPTSIRDLAEMFEITQPTVSVHVKALREGGLLESTKEGNLTLWRASEEYLRRWVAEAVDEVIEPACTCGTCMCCLEGKDSKLGS